MGPLGMQEMIGIFIFALVLFGPKKLPELGRNLAKALTEFRRAKNELKSTFESHLSQLEQETRIDDYVRPSSYTPPQISHPYDYSGQNETNYGYGSSTETNALPSGTESQAGTQSSTEPAPAGSATGEVKTAAHAPVQDTVARSHGVEPVKPQTEEGHPV
jgi:sec-independent protein translocase protein TatA